MERIFCMIIFISHQNQSHEALMDAWLSICYFVCLILSNRKWNKILLWKQMINDMAGLFSIMILKRTENHSWHYIISVVIEAMYVGTLWSDLVMKFYILYKKRNTGSINMWLEWLSCKKEESTSFGRYRHLLPFTKFLKNLWVVCIISWKNNIFETWNCVQFILTDICFLSLHYWAVFALVFTFSSLPFSYDFLSITKDFSRYRNRKRQGVFF